MFGIGIRELGIGIAVKAEDGKSKRATNPAVVGVLEKLNLANEE